MRTFVLSSSSLLKFLEKLSSGDISLFNFNLPKFKISKFRVGFSYSRPPRSISDVSFPTEPSPACILKDFWFRVSRMFMALPCLGDLTGVSLSSPDAKLGTMDNFLLSFFISSTFSVIKAF